MRARFLLKMILAAGVGACASQGQLVLEPVYDTYVRSDQPNDSYGSDENLFVHSGLNSLKRTYLQFDLGSIPLGSVREASLRLGFAEGAPIGRVIDVHHVADDSWNESLTWNSAPTPEAFPLATASAELGKVELVWNLPLSVFATDTDGHLSLLLKLADETLSDTVTFFSKEADRSSGADPPRLVLSVPEPPEFLLTTGLGLMLLVFHRRSCRQRTVA